MNLDLPRVKKWLAKHYTDKSIPDEIYMDMWEMVGICNGDPIKVEYGEEMLKCPNCGEITTESEIMCMVEHTGGAGCCMCRFLKLKYDEDGEMICTREYIDYEETGYIFLEEWIIDY